MLKTNVIVIVSDTMRWDALGANGGPGWLDIKTPELDRFASESACFDFARVSSFPTIPMRTDCFTGRFSHPRYGWQELESVLVSPTIASQVSRFTHHAILTEAVGPRPAAFVVSNPYVSPAEVGIG